MVGDDDNQIKKRLLINMLEISYERTTMQSRWEWQHAMTTTHSWIMQPSTTVVWKSYRARSTMLSTRRHTKHTYH